MKPKIFFISLIITLCFLSCENPSDPNMGYVKGYVSKNNQLPVSEAGVFLHNAIYSNKIVDVDAEYDSKEEALQSIQSDYKVLNRETNAGGYFRFDYVLVGDYVLEVNKGDSIGRVINVDLTDNNNGLHFDINLYETGSIAVKFSKGDLVFIKEIMRADTCANNGKLLMEGIPQGVYSVYLFQNNVFTEFQGGKVEVFQGETTEISDSTVTIQCISILE